MKEAKNEFFYKLYMHSLHKYMHMYLFTFCPTPAVS